MSVEEEIRDFIEDELLAASMCGCFCECECDEYLGIGVGAAADRIMECIREKIGATQEKLMLDLSIARSAQYAAEGREQALEDTCADLYRQLATLHKERLDADT